MFFNQQQLAVWESPRHQVIRGVARSGKTLLIPHKALECARKGEKVVIYVGSRKLWHMYFDFF
jgi:superfamily I DNA and RNA helicase